MCCLTQFLWVRNSGVASLGYPCEVRCELGLLSSEGVIGAVALTSKMAHKYGSAACKLLEKELISSPCDSLYRAAWVFLYISWLAQEWMIQERVRRKSKCLIDLVSKAMRCHFFHIIFVRSKNRRPAYTEGKWN